LRLYCGPLASQAIKRAPDGRGHAWGYNEAGDMGISGSASREGKARASVAFYDGAELRLRRARA
jgi:hypothetical protein